MSTVLVQALPGTFPSGFCPKGEGALQELYNEIILRTQFSLSADKAFYNYGNSAPTPENRQFPWLQTSSGYPVRWYVFRDGSWIWPHPVPASSDLRQIWVGDTTSLETFDGGESAAIAVTPTTGPMWAVDTDFDGRSPMGAGAIPSSTPAKTLALDEAYGEGTHLITGNELPDLSTLVKIGVAIPAQGHAADGFTESYDGGGTPVNLNGYTNDVGMYPTATLMASGFPKASVASLQTTPGTSHQTTHPVRGCYIIKRTARIYYRQ